MRIDVEDMKQSLRNLHGIEPYEGILTFFYDESGNCRKFSLTKNGVNSEDSLWGDFVLAGVAYDGVENNIDFWDMYQALEYKEGQKELKFKHLYHNSSDFCSFLNSKRLTGFLRWLRNSGLFIHYSALNNYFFEKSHENIYIQISDMIAGLLRKLFAFLDATTFQTALSLSKELNETQKRNLMVIWELITISDHKSVLFIKNANTPKNTQDRMAKLHILAGV